MFNVGNIALVGITIVFLCFAVLFFLFKFLGFVFGDKTKKRASNQEHKENKPKFGHKETSGSKKEEKNDLELVAVITASIESFTNKKIRLLNMKEIPKREALPFRRHREVIWRPRRKGEKKTW